MKSLWIFTLDRLLRLTLASIFRGLIFWCQRFCYCAPRGLCGRRLTQALTLILFAHGRPLSSIASSIFFSPQRSHSVTNSKMQDKKRMTEAKILSTSKSFCPASCVLQKCDQQDAGRRTAPQDACWLRTLPTCTSYVYYVLGNATLMLVHIVHFTSTYVCI